MILASDKEAHRTSMNVDTNMTTDTYTIIDNKNNIVEDYER